MVNIIMKNVILGISELCTNSGTSGYTQAIKERRYSYCIGRAAPAASII